MTLEVLFWGWEWCYHCAGEGSSEGALWSPEGTQPCQSFGCSWKSPHYCVILAMSIEMCVLTMHTNHSRVRNGVALLPCKAKAAQRAKNGDQIGAMPECVLPCARLLIDRVSGNAPGLYWECGFHGSVWKAG